MTLRRNDAVAQVRRFGVARSAVPALALLAWAATASATDGEIFGGPGGGYYRQECPAGEYLVGVAGRTGAWLDAVQVVCAPRIGNEYRLGASVVRASPAGGAGGAPNGAKCPVTNGGAMVVTAIDSELTLNNGQAAYVSGLEIDCENFQPPFHSATGPSSVVMSASGDGEPVRYGLTQWARDRVSTICPPGEVGIGIQGRSGDFVDALGILCALPPVPPSQPSLATKVQSSVQAGGFRSAPVKRIGTARPPGFATPSPAAPPPAAPPATPPGPPVAPAAPPPAALPAGYALPNIFYAITRAGALNWYCHTDAESQAATRLAGPILVGTSKWDAFYQLLAGGGNHLYGLTRDGDLLWYRHDGYSNGAMRWRGPVKISAHFQDFNVAFGGGEGVIYFVSLDGALHWARHTGFETGDPNAWISERVVAQGWSLYQHVFSTGAGVIYAVDPHGALLRFRHVDYLTGGTQWEGPLQVGSGWNNLLQVFSTGNGVVYAVTYDGQLEYFRHASWNSATPDQSWFGPVTVAKGWSRTEPVIPVIP